MTGEPPLRLLYVSARYPPYVGGTEIHTAEVATRLAARGHHVSVITTDPTHTVPFEDERDGVRVLTVPAWPRDRDWYVAPDVARVLRDEPRDLLHVQGYHTAVAPIAMATAVRHHQPFVLTFHSGGHSSLVRRAIRPVQRTLMRPLLRRAECLIGVSTFETNLFARGLGLPASRFATIPNGTSFEPSRLAMSGGAGQVLLDDVPHLVSVGRLERYKGYERVIDALPALRRRLGSVRYTIVGSGPDRHRLESRADRLGVRDSIEFRSVPVERRAELVQILQTASVFVLMSDYESQGMSVLEARSLGVPILVAATSALADLSSEPGVWAVPARSRPDQVADAVMEVMQAPRHSSDVTLPRWDEIADRLLGVYCQLLGRGA
jgi:glycosyltransferase involved in cell wall biosynthesis